MLLKISGNIENVIDRYDFAYLVEKYMGYEARCYYKDMLDEYDAQIADLHDDIVSLEEQLGESDDA